MDFKEIGDPTFIALETFRKSGEGKVTPVWVVADGGRLYVWTAADSWKVKRILNTGRVRVAVSDARGNPHSDWMDARARVLDSPEEVARQRERMESKYGLQFRLISFMNKLRRENSRHVAIEISEAQGSQL